MTEQSKNHLDIANPNHRELTKVVSQYASVRDQIIKQHVTDQTTQLAEIQRNSMDQMLGMLQNNPDLIDIFDSNK